MEKLGKTKHDHKAVKIFKLTIFFILMLAPFLSVLTTCLYTTFNPNAMESTSFTETQYRKVEYQTNEVNSIDDLVVGNVYNLKIDPQVGINIQTYQFGLYQNATFLYFEEYINTYNTDLTNAVYIIPYTTLNYPVYIMRLNLDNSTYIQLGQLNTGDTFKNLPFIYNGGNIDITNVSIADLTQIPSQYEEIETTTLDNAFNYAVNNLANNNLFNWTMNTAMYTTINSVCSGLTMGTSGNILAMLITYWILLTIIYILFDIIIEMFVKLTHIFA